MATRTYEDFNNYNREQLAFAVRNLAKTANQRLREIEKQNLTKASNAYRYVERQAFDEQQFIAYTSKGQIKFDTNTRKKTFWELKEEVAELRTFLYESKTSTVKGTRERYRKSYEAYKENNGTELSFEEFGEMWLQNNMKKAIKMYGSDVAVDIYSGEYSKALTMQEINDIIGQIDEGKATLTRLKSLVKDKEESKKLSTNDLDDDTMEFEIPFA